MTEPPADFPYATALIVGAGAGISASLARRLSALGVKVGLAARNIDKLHSLLQESRAIAFAADARDPAARELGPKGIHVAHFIIDGGVRSGRRHEPGDQPDSMLDPDAIAQTYLDVLRQHRSAWSFEVEVRPWVERF